MENTEVLMRRDREAKSDTHPVAASSSFKTQPRILQVKQEQNKIHSDEKCNLVCINATLLYSYQAGIFKMSPSLVAILFPANAVG